MRVTGCEGEDYREVKQALVRPYPARSREERRQRRLRVRLIYGINEQPSSAASLGSVGQDQELPQNDKVNRMDIDGRRRLW